MSMLVARMQKMKSENLIGIGNHNQRKTKTHTNLDIDTTLSEFNYDLVNRTTNYKRDIESFINENKSTSRAIRKDAVLINEWIVTSDRKFFESLSGDEVKKFFTSAKDYFSENFGEENIRYATVHLDESTPHMHMGIVPFDNNNKLSAKRVFNRETLLKIQEDLPKYLQEKGFEINRGLEGSNRKNLTVPEFKELKKEQERLKHEIRLKKEELIAYNTKTKVDKLDVVAKKEIKDVVVVTNRKNIFGKNKKEKVSQWTGNVVLSEDEFLRMSKIIKTGKEKENQLNRILKTDIYKENQNLKMQLESEQDLKKAAIKKSYSVADYYEGQMRILKDENTRLKAQISDLKGQIDVIYNSTRDFIKSSIIDSRAFKDIFESLIRTISKNNKKKNLKDEFREKFNSEFKKVSERGFGR